MICIQFRQAYRYLKYIGYLKNDVADVWEKIPIFIVMVDIKTNTTKHGILRYKSKPLYDVTHVVKRSSILKPSLIYRETKVKKVDTGSVVSEILEENWLSRIKDI